jgi:hypothetical protein
MILVVCSFLVIKEAVSDPNYVIQQNILTACTHLKRIRGMKNISLSKGFNSPIFSVKTACVSFIFSPKSPIKTAEKTWFLSIS